MSVAPGASERAGSAPAAPVEGAQVPYRAALVVAALCVVISITYTNGDADVWQHLLVGKAIWSAHAVPRTNLWTWPTWGEPQVLPSWGFRALLWPFWAVGGVAGLIAWRWLTTLAAFALALATARRMGARGVITLVVLVVCALVYRRRTQIRPETLVGILLALEIWILETRRAGGRDASPWLIGVAWVWANVHLSYPLGLAVLGCHALDDRWPRAGDPRGGPRLRLTGIGLAAVAVSFLNPFGWRALWQPFEYLLTLRHEIIFQEIGELRPVEWASNVWNGLPLLVAAWPLLALWRWRRAGFDRVETFMLVTFIGIGLWSQRFLGFLAIAAAPYVARDLDAWLAGARWRAALRGRRRMAPAGRAAVAACACVALSLPEWLLSPYTPGLGFSLADMPVAACDFMSAHGVRGRGYNPFHFGGYLLWRFWPERARLPFMDIHQTGTPEDRALAGAAFWDAAAYRRLMARHAFDYALVDRGTPAQFPMLDFLDRDSTWTLVFTDDVAALYVRRAGPLAAIADSFAYRAWPAGFGALGPLYRRYAADSSWRALADAELARQVASSPRNATARFFTANLALLEGRAGDAERELRAALAVAPWLPRAHFHLGTLALDAGRPREAAREFEREQRSDDHGAGTAMPIARAWAQYGDREQARRWYRRALRGPDGPAARDSLATLERGPKP